MGKPKIVTVFCAECETPLKKPNYRIKTLNFCRSCNQSGPLNPMWRGGHHSWQKGKLGKDKDGLSYKSQRRLAWERDNYKCVDCGKTKEENGRNLDCDHEIPYRISFSHALENLKTRCKSCHKRVEAKRTELWGGQIFNGSIGKNRRIPCKSCGAIRRKKNELGYCLSCNRREILLPQVRVLRSLGKSMEDIGKTLGITKASVSIWLRKYSD